MYVFQQTLLVGQSMNFGSCATYIPESHLHFCHWQHLAFDGLNATMLDSQPAGTGYRIDPLNCNNPLQHKQIVDQVKSKLRYVWKTYRINIVFTFQICCRQLSVPSLNQGLENCLQFQDPSQHRWWVDWSSRWHPKRRMSQN